ncbi:hypothetical protein PG985_010116 [Apiospora marii]|uniref:Uncharacterized protein n=1 Tax=Apiospora marii TaxID=335849 RepID=A0ABR1RKY5_9PEZI
MAQKGGRVLPGTDANRHAGSPSPTPTRDDNKVGSEEKAATEVESEASKATRSDTSAPPQDQDFKSRDGEQWEVLPKPGEAGASEGGEGGMSSHFDFKVGWGKWKYTVFSWDLKVGRRSQ